MTGGCARCCLQEALQSSCWCPVVWHRELRPLLRWGVHLWCYLPCPIFPSLPSLCIQTVQGGREDLPHIPDSPACPCCMHWCRCFQEAPENSDSPVDAGMVLQYGIWPRGQLSGEKRKRGEAGESHSFPLTDIREDSTLTVRTARVRSKLLHVCLKVWEEQWGRDLCDIAKCLLGYDLKLPSRWMLQFSSDSIRRSFQASTAEYSLFWASAGQFLSALTGVRWKNVGYCDSLASFAVMMKGVWVRKKESRCWEREKYNLKLKLRFLLFFYKLLNFFFDCFPK